MEIIKTFIEDLVIIQPKVFEDERGYFMESFKDSFIKENFPEIKFIQDNESKSSYGVLRGLHFQKPPFEQTKLVRVIEGEIQDVAVDLRKESPTYGKYYSIVLSGTNKKQLLIPKGFAHGFLTLSDYAILSYKVDEIYSPTHDFGIIYYCSLYFLGIVFSTLPSIIKHNQNPSYFSLGASGAVSSVVFAYIIVYPLRELGLLILPGIWLPGFIFGALYLISEHLLSKKQYSNIAHDAHISGAVFGIIFIFLYDFNNILKFVQKITHYFTTF